MHRHFAPVIANGGYSWSRVHSPECVLLHKALRVTIRKCILLKIFIYCYTCINARGPYSCKYVRLPLFSPLPPGWCNLLIRRFIVFARIVSFLLVSQFRFSTATLRRAVLVDVVFP